MMEFDFSLFDVHIFPECWWFNILDIDNGWICGSLMAVGHSYGRWWVDVFYLRQVYFYIKDRE